MKKLYEFSWEFRRMGSIEGLFIADEAAVAKLIGKHIYFGEVLGKHSEVYGDLEEKDLTVKSDDQEFINKFIEIMGDGTISGYNPLDYYEEDDEDEED